MKWYNDSSRKYDWPWQNIIEKDMFIDKIDWPLISIVTPNYNGGNYLEEAIRSVILQSYPNLQYLIIDGGSNDNSIEIIEKYSKYIDYWESNEDSGPAEAINKGMKKAKGEIVSWLNSDDLLSSTSLYNIAATFCKNKNIDLIYGTGFYFDDKGYYWLSKKNYDEFDARSITHFAFDLQPSIFFRKSIFAHIGYLDESFPLQFDTELFIRASLNHEMLKIPYYLSFFRQHNRRLTKIKYAEMKYPEELVRIYSRVLCSLESKNDVQEYINIAKDLDLFIDEQIRYPINKVFDQTLIKRSFYIYLIKCCINFYEKNNLKELRNILSVLKHNFKDFYSRDFEAKRIDKMSQFIWAQKLVPRRIRKRIQNTRYRYWLNRNDLYVENYQNYVNLKEKL